MQRDKKNLRNFSPQQKEAIFQQAARVLGERREIGFAYAYGSMLEDTPCHDLDIAIYVLNPRAIDNSLLFAAEISGELENLLHFLTDVRIINVAPVPFLFSVIRGRLLCEREPEIRQLFVEDVMHRYYDIKPVLAHATKEAFAP